MTQFTQNVSARFAAGAIGVAMMASMTLGAAAPALAAGLTASQQSAILSLLQSFGADAKTVSDVQASLNGQPTTGSTSSTVTTGTTFTRTLQVGSTGADVKALQVLLNSDAATQVAKTGAGSPGMEGTVFGPATKAAVMKFQKAHGLAQVGLVGPSTRAALNAMGGSTTSTTTTTTTTTTNNGTTTTTVAPSGPGLTVAMAATQPANSLAPQNGARVPFTTFTLTNNTANTVTVSSVTVARAGLAQDAVFSGVVLLDSTGAQIGIAHTFNSNHQANIGDGFTLAAGASMTYTVGGNMNSSLAAYAGQVAQLQVVAVNTSVPVAGSLPISGASQTINASLAVGQVSTSTSSYDPGGNQTKTIGDTNIRFSGLRFTASSAEDLKLFSIRWRQVGTAGASDFGNVVTVVNGTSYPTTLDTSGKYYTSVFPNGILITKGNSVDAYVQGDITGTNSANRSITFDIDKVTDVYFVGQLYGYGIAPNGTNSPWFHTGYATNIQAGTASVIQNATAVASANIPVNVNNTVLGGFQTSFNGEPVSVSGLTFTAATTTGATGGVLTSVSLVDENGAVVAGPVDQASTATNGSSSIVFTDTVTFPVGLHTYTLKGKVPSAWTNGSTVTIGTTANSTNWTNPTGQTTGNTVTLPVGVVTMNTMTIKGAFFTITSSPNPVAQTIVAGQAVTLGNIQLDASQSGEDIRLNALKLSEVGSDNAPAELNACQVYNGTTALNTGGNVLNTITNDAFTSGTTTAASSVFNFDNTLTVPKGTVMTLTVKCNIATGGTANGSYGFATLNAAAGAPTVTGVQSGNSLTLNTNLFVISGQSGAQTVNTTGGTLAVSVDSSSPSFTLAADGTTGVTVGVLKLRASNENVNLTKLGLQLTNSGNTKSSGSGASTNSGVNDLNQVYIYQGSTLVGTMTFTGTTAFATSTLMAPITLVKDTDTLLTIKADLATIGASASGGIGDVIKVDPLNAQGSGASSGMTVNSGATTGVAGIQMFSSFPTFAAGPAVAANPNGSNQALKKFSITANAAGSIGLSQIAVALATTSAAVTNLKLYAYTDSGYSQPANVPGTTGGQFGGTALDAVGAVDIAAPTVTFYQTTPLQVSAGTTLYFSVNGTVAPTASANNWTVGVTVLGDTSSTTDPAGYNATTTPGRTSYVAGVATSTTGYNFLWSDNATGTATGNSIDWSNGYYVPGLPSSGF